MASKYTRIFTVSVLLILVILYIAITIMQYYSLKTALEIRQTQRDRAKIGTDIQLTTHLNDVRLRRIEASLGIVSPITSESLVK